MKQKKIWLIAFFSAVVLTVGLVIAIVVVINIKKDDECTTCENISELVENEDELKKAMTIYTEKTEEITKAIENLDPDDKDGVIYTYQYYIDKTDNVFAKAMLEALFLQVQMGYDKDNTRGDELITEALEIDEKMKTVDSAILVINLANNYGKNELYNKYETILNEREAAKGVDMEMETRG